MTGPEETRALGGWTVNGDWPVTFVRRALVGVGYDLEASGLVNPFESWFESSISRRPDRFYAFKEAVDRLRLDDLRLSSIMRSTVCPTEREIQAIEVATSGDVTASALRAYFTRNEVIAVAHAVCEIPRLVRTARKVYNQTKRSCELCPRPDSEGHHDDYFQPTVVMWLCRACHKRRHVELRRAGIDPRTMYFAGRIAGRPAPEAAK